MFSCHTRANDNYTVKFEEMLTNHHFAILAKVNELGERFDLKPSHFLVTLENNESTAEYVLQYCMGPNVACSSKTISDAEAAKLQGRYEAMLTSLGIQDGAEIVALDDAILDKLDAALQRAPKPRLR